MCESSAAFEHKEEINILVPQDGRERLANMKISGTSMTLYGKD
jgi:hypothetical protein